MKLIFKNFVKEAFSWCEMYGKARAATYLTRSGRVKEAIQLMKK
jgi:hypothetical protein